MPVCNSVTILFLKTGIHKVLSIKPGAWVYDVLMLGEIEFALLNSRWMYPGRTNHLFCSVHVSFSVSCQLCWLSDQSSLWRPSRTCNFILATISVNMLFVTLGVFEELNVSFWKIKNQTCRKCCAALMALAYWFIKMIFFFYYYCFLILPGKIYSIKSNTSVDLHP